MKNELRTCDWRNRIEITETIGDLRTLLISLEQSEHDWSHYFCNEMVARGMKTLKMASLCGVSRQTIAHWKGQNHLPKSREQYINIAMAFGMNIDETNHLLQRYGLFPKLYARNIRDAVRIYAIQSRLKRIPEAIEYDEQPYRYVLALDEQLHTILSARTEMAKNDKYVPTVNVDESINMLSDSSTLEQYLTEHVGDFPYAPYRKLDSMIHSYIDIQDSEGATINSLVERGFFDAEFNTLFSQLHRHGEVPARDKLITAGIRFNMTVEMLDRLLILAGGEALCARIPEEAALIFAVRSAHLYNPLLEYELALLLSRRAKDMDTRSLAQQYLRDYDNTWGNSAPKSVEFGSVKRFVRYVLNKVSDVLPGAADKYCPMEHKL